jgi:hypothetical protein
LPDLDKNSDEFKREAYDTRIQRDERFAYSLDEWRFFSGMNMWNVIQSWKIKAEEHHEN